MTDRRTLDETLEHGAPGAVAVEVPGGPRLTYAEIRAQVTQEFPATPGGVGGESPPGLPAQLRAAREAKGLTWYAVAGWFSLLVGRHRDAEYPEALRRGAIDLGRAVRQLVLR